MKDEAKLLEIQLEELKEALKWIDELKPKAVYKVFANSVAIEVEPEKAKEYIEKEIKKLEEKLKSLRGTQPS